jgi:hypothetical protein
MSKELKYPNRALAHYLWPPQWVGDPLAWMQSGAVPDPSELGHLVVGADLPGGIRSRVFRDGEIVFVLGPDGPTYDGAFVEWVQTLVRLMNAHLWCLRASIPWPGLTSGSSVVTTWSTLQVDFETGRFFAASTGQHGPIALELNDARRALTGQVDWRLNRGSLIISTDSVRRSFDLLRDLLELPQSPEASDLLKRPGLFRAELLQRAAVAVFDQDFTGALTNAWTACEGMLGDLMRRALAEASERDVGRDDKGNKLAFMKADRRRFFERGEWTIRHTMEFLSLADRLPFVMYREARECAKARNEWLHYETVPSPEIADKALKLGGALFELVQGVSFKPPGSPGGDGA